MFYTHLINNHPVGTYNNTGRTRGICFNFERVISNIAHPQEDPTLKSPCRYSNNIIGNAHVIRFNFVRVISNFACIPRKRLCKRGITPFKRVNGSRTVSSDPDIKPPILRRDSCELYYTRRDVHS